MRDLDADRDPKLTQSELALVSRLTDQQIKEIDQAILSAVDDQFRKVAFIVGSVMTSIGNGYEGVPDGYYAQRIFHFIESGELTAQGLAGYMRYCEVKHSS